MDETNIPVYIETPSTIKVAGGTIPKGAGRCAFHYLQQSKLPIDFMVIGANANQQATKAMGIFCYMVTNAPEFAGIQVAFQPLLYKTLTHSDTNEKFKSVTVWRTIILEPNKPKGVPSAVI